MSAVLARPPFSAYARPNGGLTHRVDEQEMRQLLTAAGFEVKSIEARIRSATSPRRRRWCAIPKPVPSAICSPTCPSSSAPSAREVIGRELVELAAADGTISQSSRRMMAVAYLRTLPGRLTTAPASE